jgi:hypothetical protein
MPLCVIVTVTCLAAASNRHVPSSRGIPLREEPFEIRARHLFHDVTEVG